MAEIIKKIKNLFKQLTPNPAKSVAMDNLPPPAAPRSLLNEAALRSLMQQVEQTKEGTYSCDETFALLDEYVELVSTEDEAARLMPLVEAHLEACSGCKQKYDVLRAILNSEGTEQ